MCRKSFQVGISMVELLVALAIGSFLVLGITQVYIDNRRSYAFQQSQGENQEGSRYAMLVLHQELEKAGYRRLPDVSMDFAFPADSTLAGCSFKKGQTVLWNNTSNSLCIRYQPLSNTDRDCLGNTAAAPATPYTATNEKFIERLYLDGDKLMCASSSNAAAGELITGVADLRFELGLANSIDSRVLDRYVAQGAVTDEIIAVRYMALLRSSAGQVRDTSANSPVLTQWQVLSGVSAAEITALNDSDRGQLYQISQSTVMLRNLMP